MSFLNENISIKIKDVGFMKWGISTVDVAARPYHALVFRLSGCASFMHGDLHLDTCEGDVFYMPAEYNYKAEYHEQNEILFIHFESDVDSEMENYQLNNRHVVSVLFNKLYELWTKKEEGYYYRALGAVCEILENISIQHTTDLNSETIKMFDKAVEYMEKNYCDCELTVEKIVSVSCMSNTYFRKLFIRRFGMTPAKYIRSKRLMHAEKLLSMGKYSIREVAEMSGFFDVKYFCRVVKQEYGVAPSKLYCYIDI